MYASRTSRLRGFSLVELMVALVFTAILTTGMLRVFASNVSNFYTSQETLGLQRSSRFALNVIQEELLQAGYLFPPRNLRNDISVTDSSTQPPLLLQTTDYTPVWSDPNGTSVTLPKVDELQFVQDLNLNVEGTLTVAVVKGEGTATVHIPSGASTLNYFTTSTTDNPLVMVMLDSQPNQVDMLRVKSVVASGSDYTVTFDTTSSGLDKFGNEQNGGFFTGTFNNPHTTEAPCMFIAPLQVVRYAVVPRSLDPSDPTAVVPCLVRQTAPLVKASIFAPLKDSTAPSQNVAWTEQIIAEGVSGLKTDISLDGGKTWQRYKNDGTLNAGADTWANFFAVLNTAVTNARSSSSPLYAYTKFGIQNATDPMWINYLPVTLRLDLETRTRLARSEYGQTGPTPNQPTFRTRTITMLIAPRNFALGNPQ